MNNHNVKLITITFILKYRAALEIITLLCDVMFSVGLLAVSQIFDGGWVSTQNRPH